MMLAGRWPIRLRQPRDIEREAAAIRANCHKVTKDVSACIRVSE